MVTEQPSRSASNGTSHQGPPARALLDEVDAISQVSRETPRLSTSLILAAWRGQEARALELIEATLQDARPMGADWAVALGEYARAVLYNGLARYEAVLNTVRRSYAQTGPLSAWALAEVIEASARTGGSGTPALRRLERQTPSDGAVATLGVLAQSRALIADGEDAEGYYLEALTLARSGPALHLARSQLLYGEWLRREGRRVDAREQLRAAHGTFSGVGAAGFAERACRELLATGETVRKRTVETRDELTAQEAQIAQLAGAGYTNPEIGAELFISPRTAEWHLRKVFVKLGISSRRELRVERPRPGLAAVPARPARFRPPSAPVEAMTTPGRASGRLA